MKNLICIALCAFAIFASIGFIEGRKLKNDPQAMNKLVLSGISLRYAPSTSGPSTKSNRTVLLNYECKQSVMMSWDVKQKSLHLSNRTLASALSHSPNSEPLTKFPIASSSILAVLGGSAGAWNAKDLLKDFKDAEGSRAKQVFAAVLGGLSGYWTGYKLAVLSLPSCDSPQLLAAYSSEEKWKELEKEEFELAILAAVRQILQMQDADIQQFLLERLRTEVQRVRLPWTATDKRIVSDGASCRWVGIRRGASETGASRQKV